MRSTEWLCFGAGTCCMHGARFGSAQRPAEAQGPTLTRKPESAEVKPSAFGDGELPDALCVPKEEVVQALPQLPFNQNAVV